jgi:hypothetical protein
MKTLLILIGLLLLLQPEQTQANELDWLVGWETPNDSGKIVDSHDIVQTNRPVKKTTTRFR